MFVFPSRFTCQRLDGFSDLGKKREIVRFVVRIDAANRLLKEVQTADKDKLPFRAAQGDVDATRAGSRR